MKKLIFSIALFLGCISISYGQFGIKAGVQISTLVYSGGNVTIESDNLGSFQLGGFYQMKISKHFAFRPGLSVIGKGAAFGEETTFLTYLEVPLDFMYCFGEGETGFWISLGPYIASLSSAKSDGEDVSEGLKGGDVGLNLGVGYDFENLTVGLYGGQSAGTILEGDSGGVTVKNSSGSLFVAYRF